ncbi:MAG: alpha/beta hydrolase [Chloroflexi bacterium]|nr:alpha/beta hydrolase [Chloroflexota bacterium]
MSQPTGLTTLRVQNRHAGYLAVEQAPGVDSHPTPILLLHGWGVHSELMKAPAKRLAALGYRCIAPDFPGFGSTPAPPTAWTVHDYAQWTLDVCDALEMPRVHLFAHSFGARVAMVMASRSPDRIDKIALTGAAGIPSKKSLSSSLRLSSYKTARSVLKTVGASALADRLSAWYGTRYGSADYQAASGVMRETFLKVVNEDLSTVAAQVRHPTLLFWGALDQETPLWQGKMLEKLIPDAGLIIYEKGDHYAYLRHQVEIARTLDYFLRH